jgi:hypothetical protein
MLPYMIKFRHKRSLFIITCFCLLFSCEKSDKPTVLKGFVTDFYSNNPVNSYGLKIVRERYFSFDGIAGFVDSIKTDSNGIFNVSLVCEHEFSYKLESDLNNVYSPIEGKVIEAGKTNDFNSRPYLSTRLRTGRQSLHTSNFKINSTLKSVLYLSVLF